MKRFYCYKCDEYSRTARAIITTGWPVRLEIDAAGHVTGYCTGEIDVSGLEPEKMECDCGAIVIITEDPCDHRWGETTYGYGDAEGKTKRVCRDCDKIEFGTGTRPVWE